MIEYKFGNISTKFRLFIEFLFHVFLFIPFHSIQLHIIMARIKRATLPTKKSIEHAKQRRKIQRYFLHVSVKQSPLVFYSKSKDEKSRLLSNFAHCNLIIDDQPFATLEHYYQYSKFIKEHPQHACRFITNHSNWIGNDPIQAKRLGSKKSGVLQDKGFSPYFSMLCGLRAKFQLPEFKSVLISTGYRTLEHFERGRNPYWGKCGDKGQNQ